MSGSLFVCASPIGNLSDCTFRLIETLQSVDLIATEDTRTTQILLQKYQISKKCISLEKHNEAERVTTLIQVLGSGNDIALISEAGTPNIADPGSFVIEKIREAGFKIVPIPGPSAITTLLSVSGFLANQFVFMGFFPKKPTDAMKSLGSVRALGILIVYFEAANRLLKTILQVQLIDPYAEIFLGKELTKYFETFFKGSVSQSLEFLNALSQAGTLKGEWCFAIQFSPEKPDTDACAKMVSKLQNIGLENHQIIRISKEILDLPKNEVYQLLIKESNSNDDD